MIPVLVTGANGQLGSEIKRSAPDHSGMSFIFTDIAGLDGDISGLDITKKKAVENFMDANPVKYIINCAAYTAVDNAEDDPDAAMLLNGDAVRILAEVSAAREIQLIHISTDYVFNGENNRPYRIDDPVDPQTVYGRTKLAGEEAVKGAGSGIIIRTSWLYSVFGHNFVKTILRLSRERDKLQVVFDQTGSPTNAKDLAKAIIEMVSTDSKGERKPRYDVYHFSNMGMCSWYELAGLIIKLAGSECIVEPVESVNYPTRTVRPRYSALDKSKLLADYLIEIPHWKSSLEVCMKELT